VPCALAGINHEILTAASNASAATRFIRNLLFDFKNGAEGRKFFRASGPALRFSEFNTENTKIAQRNRINRMKE
jgi:hypothetical protein